jgi:hypothetical protein
MTDETLEILWKNVTDRWDDDSAHQAFLQHCQSTEQLGEAARLYAGVKRDAARSAAAKRRLEAVATLAAASLQASREPPPAVRPRWLIVFTALVFGSLTGYALYRALLL